MDSTNNKMEKIKDLGDFLQSLWDELLPTIVEKTVIHSDLYKELFLVEKILKALTKELKERALLFPDYYPVKISERKNFIYNKEDEILKDLIKKYQIEKFAKLKSYSSLIKEIEGDKIIDLTSKGFIAEKIIKVVKLS